MAIVGQNDKYQHCPLPLPQHQPKQANEFTPDPNKGRTAYLGSHPLKSMLISHMNRVTCGLNKNQ